MHRNNQYLETGPFGENFQTSLFDHHAVGTGPTSGWSHACRANKIEWLVDLNWVNQGAFGNTAASHLLTELCLPSLYPVLQIAIMVHTRDTLSHNVPKMLRCRIVRSSTKEKFPI